MSAERVPTGEFVSTNVRRKAQQSTGADTFTNMSGKEQDSDILSDDDNSDRSVYLEYCGCDPTDTSKTNIYKERLKSIFGKVNPPGQFCGGDRFICKDVSIPQLHIVGVKDQLVLPLQIPYAQLIIEKCSLAPFGRQYQTILDKTIRNTWQLDPLSFRIRNPQWSTLILSGLKSQILKDLGFISDYPIDLQLYKLLLYEKGSFFKSHRDSEKVRGMFATLVVLLPSSYSGGEFIIRHNKVERKFDFSGAERQNDYHYIVFYAGCEHEIRPIHSGYRLALIYNVISCSTTIPSHATIFDKTLVQDLSHLLKMWASDVDSPSKLVIRLDHQYTKANGVTLLSLKNKDRVLVNLLLQAIECSKEDDSACQQSYPYDEFILGLGLLTRYLDRHEELYRYIDDEEALNQDRRNVQNYIKNFTLISKNETSLTKLTNSCDFDETKKIPVKNCELLYDNTWNLQHPGDSNQHYTGIHFTRVFGV
ncbi:unnamed protein product [Didymodactylos carnosus]|uniref:Prolyl 4-hydroxylase alpha subunit Fe(2+) 2OG dioxygenase domain-containing protein n=1 Tax=Didymodactylos carnosus TaxID=1234261 RepID=A0A814GXK2_9BILA|nr:unnamed protein product [Didymodactylos carnosus]CAF1002793.1 unnamed protein product [Didymodactylos carnosus]CAF3655684.1 unnamed protein product [Didymodactylos carnosus]CAF3774079.1 unnamed protein product [Didymodactylos carnosus]